MPAFLRSTKFADPTSATDCPFQLAYKTSKSAFEYFPELPIASQDAFNRYMSMRTINLSSWLSVFSFADETADCGPNDVVFVDVGGGIGHQCKELKEKYPDMNGRVVLQDLEHAVSGRLEHPDVEGAVHDFFNPQPIKGPSVHGVVSRLLPTLRTEIRTKVFLLMFDSRSTALLPSCRFA